METQELKKTKDFTFYKLASSIVIRYNQKTYTFHKTDHRYEKVVSAIDSKDYENFEALLDPTKVLNEEGFCVKNGVIFFKDYAIPTVLGDQFLEYKLDKVSFMGLVNFWLNLKNRHDFEHSYDHIINLIQQKGYPVTEDGFYIAYKQQADQIEVRFDTKKQIFTPFYNYGKLSNIYQTMFDEKLSLAKMLEETFGFCSKKLLKLATERVFQKGNPYVEEGFFNLGVALKGVLSPNNIFTVIEKNLYPMTGSHIAHVRMNRFWNDFAKKKDGGISEARILNLLNTKYSHDQLIELGSFWESLTKEKLNLDLQATNFATNVDAIHKYLAHEVRKLTDPYFELNCETIFPVIKNIENKIVNDLTVLIPKSNYELVEWSQKLSNCLYDYPNRVQKGECLIIGFCDSKGKMIYSLEVRNGQVHQFRSKHNNEPHKEDFCPILDFLFENKIIHTIKCKDSSVCGNLIAQFPGY